MSPTTFPLSFTETDARISCPCTGYLKKQNNDACLINNLHNFQLFYLIIPSTFKKSPKRLFYRIITVII